MLACEMISETGPGFTTEDHARVLEFYAEYIEKVFVFYSLYAGISFEDMQERVAELYGGKLVVR